MRIALSTSVMQRGRSGVGQYVLALVRALLPAAGHHEFTLYVLEEDLPLFDFVRGRMRLEPVAERHRPPVRNILWHQGTLPRLLRRAGTELLHVPSYRRMLWPRPCALVATIHDLAPFHVAGKYDWARMAYGRVVARQLAHRQDEIIAVSAATAGDLRSLFAVPADRITVVPNGVDHGRFNPGSPAAARAAVCPPELRDGHFFLYVARLEHPAKNHARLIAAFSRFKAAHPSDWRLVLAGSDWHGAAAIHDLIRASPYARDISALGFVAAEALPQWYRAADALVFPSLYEGFGLPAIEAMACGCPVLASTRGALGEVVGSAAGRLEPECVGQMQAQLTRIATDGRWREQLRADGLDRASDFDWKVSAAATLAVYARAADRARAPRPFLQPRGAAVSSRQPRQA
jgi:glycosyltransferase involved in cell wall biosynthesis